MKFKRKMQRNNGCMEIAKMVERMEKNGFPEELIQKVLREMFIRINNEMPFDLAIDYETGHVKLIDFPIGSIA